MVQGFLALLETKDVYFAVKLLCVNNFTPPPPPPKKKQWPVVALSNVLLTGPKNAQISGSSHNEHHHEHQDEHEDRQRHGDECNPKYLH